jgi:predicted GIY-YIG superfamily endonuclease
MLQTPVIPSVAVVRETDDYGVKGPCVPLKPAMRRGYRFYVYIMQSASRRALYIGMTNNLHERVWQHKNHSFEGFTDDYNATRLVYWEVTTMSTKPLAAKSS